VGGCETGEEEKRGGGGGGGGGDKTYRFLVGKLSG